MDNTTNSAVEKKALSRVPKEQRQSWYSIAFIWIGTMICIPMLMPISSERTVKFWSRMSPWVL